MESQRNSSTLNSSTVRQLTVALVIGLAAYASYTSDWLGPSFLVTLQRFAHQLAASLLFGMQAWVSLFGGLALFRSLPRKHFGAAQAAQFPIYFRLGFFLSFLILSSLLWSHPPTNAKTVDLLQIAAVLVQFLSLLFASLYVVPNARKLQELMYSFEGESAEKVKGSNVPDEIKNIPEYAQIRKKFGKFHGLSMLLNLVSLLVLTFHLFYLSQRMTV